MNTLYSGSGIIPIIKDNNNIYYIILFKSSIRKNKLESLIEDAGGGFEGTDIQKSAIRELKEESSLLFNLEQLDNNNNNNKLEKVMSKVNFTITYMNKNYLSYLVYLESNDFNFEGLTKDFKSNMRNFWKNGFSYYTENKDIIFIPIQNIRNIKENKITDYLDKEYFLFNRTMLILNKLLQSDNLEKLVKYIIKNKIIIKKTLIDDYEYGKKYKINNLISYS